MDGIGPRSPGIVSAGLDRLARRQARVRLRQRRSDPLRPPPGRARRRRPGDRRTVGREHRVQVGAPPDEGRRARHRRHPPHRPDRRVRGGEGARRRILGGGHGPEARPVAAAGCDGRGEEPSHRCAPALRRRLSRRAGRSDRHQHEDRARPARQGGQTPGRSGADSRDRRGVRRRRGAPRHHGKAEAFAGWHDHSGEDDRLRNVRQTRSCGQRPPARDVTAVGPRDGHDPTRLGHSPPHGRHRARRHRWSGRHHGVGHAARRPRAD